MAGVLFQSFYSFRFSLNVMSGAKWLMVCWGKMERGKMAPSHFTPKGVSFSPDASVRFTPGPFIPHTKILLRRVFKRFSEEEVYSLWPSGEYYPVNWAVIGLDNDLSHVQRHIIILIDAHLFPFVHIVKRYNSFFESKCKGFHQRKHIYRYHLLNFGANELNIYIFLLL